MQQVEPKSCGNNLSQRFNFNWDFCDTSLLKIEAPRELAMREHVLLSSS